MTSAPNPARLWVIDDQTHRHEQWRESLVVANVRHTVRELPADEVRSSWVVFLHASNAEIRSSRLSKHELAARTAELVTLAKSVLDVGGRFVLFSGGSTRQSVDTTSFCDQLASFERGLHYEVLDFFSPTSCRNRLPAQFSETWRVDSLFETTREATAKEFMVALLVLCQGYLVVHALSGYGVTRLDWTHLAPILQSLSDDPNGVGSRWERVQKWQWWQEALGEASAAGWRLAEECGGDELSKGLASLKNDISSSSCVKVESVVAAAEALANQFGS